jgi:uncharacterized protein with HEPN domain
MKEDVVYLKHILDAAAKIESYIAVGREEFAAKSHLAGCRHSPVGDHR